MAVTPAAFATTGSVLTATEYNYLPRGMVQVATKNSNQTGMTSATDITSLSVTWTATSSRAYKLTLHLPVIGQSTASGYATYAITDGSSNVKQDSQFYVVNSTQTFLTLIGYETGLSGSVTRKARLTAVSAGASDVYCGAARLGILMVEDLGIF